MKKRYSETFASRKLAKKHVLATVEKTPGIFICQSKDKRFTLIAWPAIHGKPKSKFYYLSTAYCSDKDTPKKYEGISRAMEAGGVPVPQGTSFLAIAHKLYSQGGVFPISFNEIKGL